MNFKNNLITDREITALYDSKNKVVMDWSPKSGCTVVTKMFFKNMGLLEEALQYNSWVHEYRMHVFYKNHPIIEEVFSDPELFRFKVVRNPYSRAVSSYIHVMKYPVMHEVVKERLWRWNANISFRKFVKFLEKTDVLNCDPHYRLQKKFFEYGKPGTFNKIVKLESLQQGIDEVNSTTGQRFDLAGIGSGHHISRSPDIINNAFKLRWDRIKDNVPHFMHFYNDELKERVYEIYKEDFECYGYHKNDMS